MVDIRSVSFLLFAYGRIPPRESMMLIAAFPGGDVVTVCVGWGVVDIVGYGVCAAGKLDLKNIPL